MTLIIPISSMSCLSRSFPQFGISTFYSKWFSCLPQYCYNDVVSSSGDIAALENGQPESEMKSLKDIIFSKADGNSKVLQQAYVGTEILDVYIKRKVSVASSCACYEGLGVCLPKPYILNLNPKWNVV